MKKKKNENNISTIILVVMIVFILFVTILYWFYKQDLKKYSEEQKFFDNANNILKIIQNSNVNDNNTEFNISTGKIKYQIDNKQVILEESNKIYGQGTIISVKNKNWYGFIKYKDICLVKKYQNKNFIFQKECPEVETLPKKAGDWIIKNASKKELHNDKEEYLNSGLSYSSKKYFVGTNPNNYLIYSNICWRIVNITQNDSIKLVYETPVNANKTCQSVSSPISGSIALLSWDEDKSRQGNWDEASNLRERLVRWENEAKIDTIDLQIPLDLSQLASADWYIGQISSDNDSLLQDVEEERSKISEYNMKLGLLNNSDYLKISCNMSSFKSTNNCKNNNYLFKENYQWWTINSVKDSKKEGWLISRVGFVSNQAIDNSWEWKFSGTRLSTYLKPETNLIGTGTDTDPYRVMK